MNYPCVFVQCNFASDIFNQNVDTDYSVSFHEQMQLVKTWNFMFAFFVGYQMIALCKAFMANITYMWLFLLMNGINVFFQS